MIVLLVASVAGAAYLSLALYQLARFTRRRIANRSETPRISVLKPLYGADPGLYESLASFCDQEYPDFEVVFCLHDERDAAAPIVARIARDFAHVPIRIVYGENPGIANPKIANLAKPGAEPHGDLVVIADSDIWVGRDYLRAIAASFSSERTGAVTCLYGGVPNETFAARLGAMRSEEEFSPSVLVAVALAKMEFCLGATMAVRRNVLDAIGGLEALGGDLADDYNLGKLVADRGFDVELSRYVVRTTIAETTLRALWLREVRWARTNFQASPRRPRLLVPDVRIAVRLRIRRPRARCPRLRSSSRGRDAAFGAARGGTLRLWKRTARRAVADPAARSLQLGSLGRQLGHPHGPVARCAPPDVTVTR